MSAPQDCTIVQVPLPQNSTAECVELHSVEREKTEIEKLVEGLVCVAEVTAFCFCFKLFTPVYAAGWLIEKHVKQHFDNVAGQTTVVCSKCMRKDT